LRKVLILEDFRDAQVWLTKAVLLAFPGAEIACCRTLESAIEWIDHNSADLCLVDLKLPDGSGLEFILHCRKIRSPAYQVVTTIYDDDAHIFPAMQAGARGYLLKDEPQSTIAGALESALNGGGPPLSSKVTQQMMRHFQKNAFLANTTNATGPDASCDLSPREQETLAIIARGHTVARTAELMGVSYHTAARHVKNLYGKLGISGRAEAVSEAIRLGLYNPNS
jgi:DNA-binding NarL/FixJ family response regulator